MVAANTSKPCHVVVGASGGTGAALVRCLAAGGRQVRAVSRRGGGPRGETIESACVDAMDADAMRAVCADAAVVYHCVNPPFSTWREAFPRVTQTLLDAACRAGARLVFADDTWMYGRVDGPMTEQTPSHPVSWRGVLRAWMAELVLAAHARGDVEVAVGRAGELYGPGVVSVMAANVFGRALRGRPALWLGASDLPLTPCFVEDFARCLMVLGDRGDAAGAVWHVPTAEPLTGRQFLDLVYAALGRPSRFISIGSRTVSALKPFLPLAREGAELVYQFEQPFVVDGDAYRRRFGDVATPYQQAIDLTLAWYRERGSFAAAR